jgi:hypothetical protein
VRNQLFPQPADNVYRGNRLALLIFVLLLFIKAGIGLGTIFNGRGAARMSDGIPLDSYTPAGAQTVVSLYAVLGLAHVIICLIGIIVMVRYRSLVPLMFALLLLQQVGRQAILIVLPIARAGTPAVGPINLTMLGLLLVGFALSMWSGNKDSRTSVVSG